MRVEDLSFPDPRKNLEYDDELLRSAESRQGGEVLRFWEPASVFVVLGRICREDFEVDLEACTRDGIPVLRRSSGGGTVVQGPGCLNFSLVLARSRHPEIASITASYRHILEKVVFSLQACGIEAGFRPICDLVLLPEEKKISGNAQRRGRTHLLHHGTILYDLDLSLISRFLKFPPRAPEYRRGRSHGDFVANAPLDAACFKAAMARVWK